MTATTHKLNDGHQRNAHGRAQTEGQSCFAEVTDSCVTMPLEAVPDRIGNKTGEAVDGARTRRVVEADGQGTRVSPRRRH